MANNAASFQAGKSAQNFSTKVRRQVPASQSVAGRTQGGGKQAVFDNGAGMSPLQQGHALADKPLASGVSNMRTLKGLTR